MILKLCTPKQVFVLEKIFDVSIVILATLFVRKKLSCYFDARSFLPLNLLYINAFDGNDFRKVEVS